MVRTNSLAARVLAWIIMKHKNGLTEVGEYEAFLLLVSILQREQGKTNVMWVSCGFS
jgi:hypothetical protein